MASAIKKIGRGILRAYLTYTPVKKGRYPLMMALHKYFKEPITVQVKTKDRGIAVLDLGDESQYTLYYNMYEWIYLPVINSLVEGTDVVLDIGANIGQYALLFAQKAKLIYAFEPSPPMIERLKKHIEINNLASRVKIVPKALSDKPGQLRLSIPSPTNTGMATTIIDEKSGLQTLTIEAITLDDYLASEGVKKVDIVKMDIEGGELSALRGMKRLLGGENPPIVILEMFDKAMQTAGYTSKDIISELQPYGYQPYQFLRNGKLSSLKGAAIEPRAENYCFLLEEHLKMPKVRRVLE
ncbi:MAG TPA: FkbM family methyltransferase [Candidatus Kapabacteria bacterium]|nr:FkbM family methyltransferase [Candidatus Kapabacteria bacterium]